jgi:hypothetical protein
MCVESIIMEKVGLKATRTVSAEVSLAMTERKPMKYILNSST